MPILFWLPAIIFAGMWDVASGAKARAVRAEDR
jgi:hypothetical protein